MGQSMPRNRWPRPPVRPDLNRPTTTSTGSQAETHACRFLERKGLRLVERNYRCRRGEIDLIMRDGEYLVFVEVRYRGSRGFGGGAESVTGAKQRRLVAAAGHYLQTAHAGREPPCRFDVVAVSRQTEPDWITNAFEAM